MPCKEPDCKCEFTKTELITAGLDGLFGHDKDGYCKNPTCRHHVGNHTDASAAVAAPRRVRKPLHDVDLSRPLSEILSFNTGEHFISQNVYDTVDRPSIGAPLGYAPVDYEYALELLLLIAKIAEFSSESEMAQVPINSELVQFLLKCGTGIDREYSPNLATTISSASAARAKGEEGADGKEYRASRSDSTLTTASVPVAEIEDKQKMQEQALDPRRQLEMCGWLPHHSKLQWRLGIIKDKNVITFVKMKKVRVGLVFKTVVDPDDQVQVRMGTDIWDSVHVLVNVAALVKKLVEQIPSLPKALTWLKLLRQCQIGKPEAGAVKVWVNTDSVHKYYSDEDIVKRLVRLYSETSEIEGLEHCLKMHDKHVNSQKRHDVFVLTPVGIPAHLWDFGPQDFKELRSHLTETLNALHKTNWVHLDLRASNVVLWEPFTPHRRWYLIDSEYARKIGSPMPSKRYTEDYQDQNCEPRHDFLMLDEMIEKMQSKKRTFQASQDRSECLPSGRLRLSTTD